MAKVELVMIPGLARGHLPPALEFAKLLIERNENLSITVLITKLPLYSKLAAYADSLIKSFAPISERLKFIDISHGNDTYIDGGPLLYVERFMQSLKPMAKRAIEDNIVATELACFVIDIACTPMVDVADELGFPTYVFWPSSAGVLGLNFHLLLGDQCAQSPMDNPDSTLFSPYFANSVPKSVFPSALLDASYVACIRRLRKMKGLILNTSAELEPHAWNALCSNSRAPPVYSVGPIVGTTFKEGETDSESIMKWLDVQPPSSVLFLCFGSMGSFGKTQVREIASALERTGFRFLWTLRSSPQKKKLTFLSEKCLDHAEFLPEGFMERTAEVGRVISWAPQTDVLAHQAIGGFVSHCGWNSVLESLWFGVPIAAWPHFAEQQLNAFEMVTELGLAVEIKMDYKSGFETGIEIDEAELVSAEVIEEGMRRMMESDSEVRKRVKEMSEKCRKSVMEGGSSHSSLSCFVRDVLANVNTLNHV